MMRARINTLIIGFFTLLGLLLFSCSEESKNARLEIRLTDAPGDYEELNIDILDVQVHAEEGEQNNGWKSLDVITGTYNLLELTNGLDTLLGSTELPAGKISQVRLVLGSNNNVKVEGITHELEIPSGQQSGLKINVHTTLTEGITYTILLDFDAARSVVKAGASGAYLLKPVIRAITEATSGAIMGSLSNPDASPAVYAIINSDTVGSTFANATGKFLIKGLPAGTYKVSFSPAEGFVINDIEGVNVTVGIVTDLGVVLID